MSFYGAVLGTFVRLTCPHCGEVQVRARRPPTTRVECRKCHRDFALSDGAPVPVAAPRRGR